MTYTYELCNTYMLFRYSYAIAYILTINSMIIYFIFKQIIDSLRIEYIF